MTRKNLQSGFGILEVILVVVVVAVLGFGGWAVLHHNKKVATNDAATSTKTSTSKSGTSQAQNQPAVTTDQLVALAKQVYYQIPADANNPASLGSCATQHTDYTSCPFNADLMQKVSNPPGVSAGNVRTLIAGAQEGPYGTISYADATPSQSSGTVTVNLAGDSSLGSGNWSFKLAMTQSTGKLVVSNIQYTRAAANGVPACGPIEIYDYQSCSQ